MKSGANDELLRSWEKVLATRATDAAIYETSGALSRTFGAIEEEAARLARAELAGIPAGSVVAIQLGNHPSWPACLLACWRRALVVLPLESGMTDPERDRALEICHAAALITSAGASSAPTMRRLHHLPIDWQGRGPVLLKLTSGTTAAPRAIRFRSAQLLADCAQICDTMGISGRDLNFGVIPVSHSYGFSNLLTPLIARGVPLVLSRDRMPRAVLDDLARTSATVFPGMPVFYQTFCELEALPALPALRLCISAGAPLSLAVAQQFREKFGRSIHSFYGASECGGICYDRAAALVAPGFVGPAMTGIELELLEPDAAVSPLRVRSAAAGDGYFPEPDDARLGEGRFFPDDLVTATPAGLRIVGRASDVINVAGKKVNPMEVEAALLDYDGVRAAVVFGRGSELRNEEVAACVVAEPGVAGTDLLEHCRTRLSAWQVPKRLFFLDELPTTERGKISRRALAERFARERDQN